MKKNARAAIRFKRKSMYFNWYMKSTVVLHLYGRYFWYLESSRATQIIAACAGNTFLGVILAEVKEERTLKHAFWRKTYLIIFDFIQRAPLTGNAGIYEKVHRQMFQAYVESDHPDGEILFLAAAPHCGLKDISTEFLAELGRRESSKRVYLYTGNACTY